MEIQTFLLATQITPRLGKFGEGFDVQNAALHTLNFPSMAEFPYRLTLPGLLVLRREIAGSVEPFYLYFNLVDEDGHSVGEPNNIRCESAFVEGMKSLYGVFNIVFEFPRPGQYRLTVATDDELTGNIFSYAIDVMRQPTPEEAVAEGSGGETGMGDE